MSEAATQALRRCRKDQREAIYAWMWRAMDSILIDRARQLAREAPAPGHANVFELPAEGADPQGRLEEQENEREVLDLFKLLADELAPRQRSVLALHVRGLKRPRLARELAVSERIVKRDLEQILALARRLLVERCGGGCEQHTRLVWRFAFGLATTQEAGQAQLHLLDCPSCQAFLGRLGWWREAAAAAIPVPTAHQLDPGLAERALHALVDRAAAAKQQLAEGATTVRQHAADVGTQAKQHTAAGYMRAVEYTPVASVRPGATATVIAGCLALGGGATYCAEQGIDPVRGVAGIVQSDQEAEPQDPPSEQGSTADAAPQPPPVVQTPPQPAPAEQPAVQTPAPELSPPPPPEPTPAGVQFGEPATASEAAASTSAPSPQPARPAPVPQNGGTDLYGP